LFHLAAHQYVAMRPDILWTERGIRSADHHDLAAAPELVRDLSEPAPLADLAGDRDEIGGVVEIHRRGVLVAELNVEIVRHHAGNSCDRQVRHRDGGPKPA